MLMTGVLITKQPSSVNLLNLPVIQNNQNIQKLIHDQSYQLISEAKATSLQPILSREIYSLIPSSIKFQPHKSRMKKIKQIFAKDLNRLTQSYSSQSFSPKAPKKQRLVAKQRRDKLVFTKSPKASFLKRHNVITEKHSSDLLVARYQGLGHQRLPNLRFRSSGVAVRVLQRLLAANGYHVQVDGSFGALTEIAVKAFQTQHNLKVDGIVGAQTWSYLTNNS